MLTKGGCQIVRLAMQVGSPVLINSLSNLKVEDIDMFLCFNNFDIP